MRKSDRQNTASKGVMDPALSDRNDLTHYYQSLADAVNGIAYPQGAFGDRGGFQLVSDADVLASGLPRRLRRRIEPVYLTAAMINATNGGTPANLLDQSSATVFTTTAVAASPFTIAEIDLGVAEQVDLIDLIGFSCATLGVNECVAVEYWNGATWVVLGGSLDNPALKHIRTTPRQRRFGGAPGYGVFARQFRVVLYGAVGAGAITVTGLRFWREAPGIAAVKVINVKRSTSASYELVLTERNIDVFETQRWQASIPVAIAPQQIPEISRTSSLDTLLLFHEHIETPRITRQGSSGEWNVEAVPWEDVPPLSSGAAFAGDQDEHQVLSLAGVAGGDPVVIYLGDIVSAPITYTDDVSFAAVLASAILALPGVAADGVDVSVAGVQSWRIRFINNNGGRAWPLVSASAIGKAVWSNTTIEQEGNDKDGPLWGAVTGWPRCGAFVQSRLLIAGFRAAPTTWIAGRTPISFNFNIGFDGLGNPVDPLTADYAFVRALDVDEVETIHEIFLGRHLQFFTESGEWYVETRALDATQPVNVLLATRNGMKSSVPIVFADGATVFVQKGGRTLRDFLFTEAEQSYTADPLNLLAPHLLTDIVAVAHRSARSVAEGNRILMVNADGTAVMLTLLRGQDVVAMCPWTTPQAAFREVMSDVNHNVLAVIERSGDLWLERWVPDMPLDGATRSLGVPRTLISNIENLEGMEVYAYADDELVGAYTVVGGEIVLDVAASDVTVGLAPDWFMRYQVVRDKPNVAQPFRAPARIYKAEISVEATGSLTLSSNGKTHREVSLLRLGDAFKDGGPLQTEDGGAPGLPMLQRLYTGYVTIGGLTGWSDHPFIELSRSVPTPVKIKQTRYEVASHG